MKPHRENMRFIIVSQFFLLGLVSCFGKEFFEFDGRNVSVTSISDKIVGGEIAKPGQFPYQVGIFRGSHLKCGGSLISPRTVLTAAHCGVKHLDAPGELWVHAGSTTAGSGGQTMRVFQIYLHPQYVRENHQNDIAVFILETGLVMNKNVAIATLPFPNTDPKEGTEHIVSGFGVEYAGAPETSPALRYVGVNIISRDTCSQSYPGLIDSQICAGFPEGGKDSCQGDSGGPLISKPKPSMPWVKTLVGVVSYGKGCAEPNYPGVYTSVSKYTYWIANYL